jgi:small subunit ribosomal protein S8
MSMNDPIADLLARIRNAALAGHEQLSIPASRLKEDILRVMKAEGFIEDYRLVEGGTNGSLQVKLRYTSQRTPVLQGLRRVSKPSLRVYVKSSEIHPVRSGLGVSILSTSRGVMTGKQARQARLGGEVLCEVW